MKVGVMQGSLKEFDLAEVLQVVGIGRQYTGIELRLANGVVGTIFVKSGQVVSATANDTAGPNAFFNLFQAIDGRLDRLVGQVMLRVAERNDDRLWCAMPIDVCAHITGT